MFNNLGGMPFLSGAVDDRPFGTRTILLMRDLRTREYVACDDIPDGPEPALKKRISEMREYFAPRELAMYVVDTQNLTVTEMLP